MGILENTNTGSYHGIPIVKEWLATTFNLSHNDYELKKVGVKTFEVVFNDKRKDIIDDKKVRMQIIVEKNNSCQ